MKNVVITGVSTGIGRAIAEKLVDEGYWVFGSVRKKAEGEKLRTEFGKRFYPLVFDVTDHKAIDRAVGEVEKQLDGQGLAGLINNAGIAVDGPLKHIELEDFEYQFQVNVFGVLKVTQSFLPLLGAEMDSKFAPGKIINMSSISGLNTYPFSVAYSASKFALEALTNGLRRELQIYGIDAVAINPGAIKTPIWDKVDLGKSSLAKTDYARFENFGRKMVEQSREKALPAETVGDLVLSILQSKRPKPNNIIMRGRAGWSFMQALPKRWQDWLIARYMSKPT